MSDTKEIAKRLKAIIKDDFGNGQDKPEPEPKKRADFPYQIIKGAAERFSNEMTAIMEPPAEFFFCSYLTCLGNALSGKIKLESELRDDPRLFLLLLGESVLRHGKARQSARPWAFSRRQ